jgi:UDP-glucose 4-epimerase
MSKKILITGGTGFIGSSLIDSLKGENYIINVGRSENPSCDNIYWNLKDNLNNNPLNDIDIIIHCASIVGNENINKSEYIDINVKSTLELLEYSIKNKIKRFVLVSTGGVYGFSEKILDEDDICKPGDIYSLSKYFSEKVCELYKDKLSIVILRLFFPYGEGQKGRLISNLYSNVLEKKRVALSRNGQPIINPVHIFDVVSIIKNIIENNLEGTFNICGDEYLSIEQICRKIGYINNMDDVEFIYGNNVVNNMMASNKRICRALNFNMRVNLDQGLKLFLMPSEKRGGI